MNKRIKVLMVDDEAQFRTTTQKILSRKGFDTVLAADGKEALSLLSENPDVVILDIKMPGMDGLAVLEEIRKRQPQIPVIMLTGHGGLPSAHKSMEEGAFDYLTKPCDADMLASKITEAVETGKRPEAEDERRVLGVMVPLKEYTVVNGKQSVREAVMALQQSFMSSMATDRILEIGHRSILVKGDSDEVIGILAITDLLNLIMPDYLTSPKPSLADSIQYSPMFWKGMFCNEIKKKADRKVEDVMSPVPLTIDGTACLMEAAYSMYRNKARRLLVVLSGKTAGILREQDLFFEMKRYLEN
ncbi:MAG: response regulator [Deltaproteobacteria bacterium]|nr:response regulator [Deltaproteobacteria bacterium]